MRRATAILLGLAAVQNLVLIIAATNSSYGYFLDELYFLACSEHLAWGYVDQPPLSIALLALIRAVFGEAVWVMRLGPILATAGVIVLTGLYGRANTLTGLIWRLLQTSTRTGTRSRMSMKQIIATLFGAGTVLTGDGRSAVGVKPALMLVP